MAWKILEQCQHNTKIWDKKIVYSLSKFISHFASNEYNVKHRLLISCPMLELHIILFLVRKTLI